jgi:hypothetical protein
LDHLWRNRSLADGAAKCADFSRSTQGCLAPMRLSFYSPPSISLGGCSSQRRQIPGRQARICAGDTREAYYCGRNGRRARPGPAARRRSGQTEVSGVPRSSGYASRRGRGRSGRNASIRNSRGDSGVMHYAVVREPRSAGIGETCRVQPALGDMPPAIETAAPQEARRS